MAKKTETVREWFEAEYRGTLSRGAGWEYGDVVKFLDMSQGHAVRTSEIKPEMIGQMRATLIANGRTEQTADRRAKMLKTIFWKIKPGMFPRPKRLCRYTHVKGSCEYAFDHQFREQLSRSSRHRLTVVLNQLSQYLGRCAMLVDLHEEMVAGFVDYLGKAGNDAFRLNWKLIHLRAFWRFCARDGLVPAMPQFKVMHPRHVPKSVRVPAAFLDGCQAYAEGVATNKHAVGTYEYNQWNAGWMESFRRAGSGIAKSTEGNEIGLAVNGHKVLDAFEITVGL